MSQEHKKTQAVNKMRQTDFSSTLEHQVDHNNLNRFQEHFEFATKLDLHQQSSRSIYQKDKDVK